MERLDYFEHVIGREIGAVPTGNEICDVVLDLLRASLAVFVDRGGDLMEVPNPLVNLALWIAHVEEVGHGCLSDDEVSQIKKAVREAFPEISE